MIPCRPKKTGPVMTPQWRSEGAARPWSWIACRTAARPATVCRSECFRNDGESGWAAGGPGWRRSTGNWSAVIVKAAWAATWQESDAVGALTSSPERFTRHPFAALVVFAELWAKAADTGPLAVRTTRPFEPEIPRAGKPDRRTGPPSRAGALV